MKERPNGMSQSLDRTRTEYDEVQEGGEKEVAQKHGDMDAATN